MTVVPSRDPFVAFLSAAEAAQIYEVRGVLKALAWGSFAQPLCATPRHVALRLWAIAGNCPRNPTDR